MPTPQGDERLGPAAPHTEDRRSRRAAFTHCRRLSEVFGVFICFLSRCLLVWVLAVNRLDLPPYTLYQNIGRLKGSKTKKSASGSSFDFFFNVFFLTSSLPPSLFDIFTSHLISTDLVAVSIPPTLLLSQRLNFTSCVAAPITRLTGDFEPHPLKLHERYLTSIAFAIDWQKRIKKLAAALHLKKKKSLGNPWPNLKYQGDASKKNGTWSLQPLSL